MNLIDWIVNARRASGWKHLREHCQKNKSPQTAIREASRIGDFKFVTMPSRYGVYLYERRSGYSNTWEYVEWFASLWAARSCAAKRVRDSEGVLH